MGNLDNIYIDPTLAAVDTAMEQAQTSRPRTSVSAGEIGNECERKLYYSFNNFPKEPFKARTLYLFEDGHLSEDIMAKRLRMVPGIELWTVDEYGKQFGFLDLNDKYKGFVDGIICGLLQAPKTNHVWEHKSCNEKKFKDLQKMITKFGEKQAFKEWDWVYYCQAVTYMQYFDMTRHYLTVTTPGCRQAISCRTEADPKLANILRGKAKRIIEAKEPPMRVSESPAYFKCKWCDFKDECHK